MSSKSDAYAVKEGNIQISRAELLNHARSILSILLALIGGWLLLKGKKGRLGDRRNAVATVKRYCHHPHGEWV